MSDVSHPPLPSLLERLRDSLPKDQKNVPFSFVLTQLEEAGIPLVLFFVCLVTAIPTPIPGLKVILGIPVILLSGHLLMGKTEIILSQRVLNQPIQINGLITAINKVLPYIEKLQGLTKPRLSHWVGNATFLRIMGGCAMVMAISIFTPMPFSNAFPALCLAVVCAGLLYNDGLLAIFGAVAGCVWVIALFSVAAILGMEAFHWILEHLIELV